MKDMMKVTDKRNFGRADVELWKVNGGEFWMVKIGERMRTFRNLRDAVEFFEGV